MAKNAEEEEDGFGDFVFAAFANHSLNQIPNRTVGSNPTMFNGPNLTTTDDDDWGDFVVGSGGLDIELSLPNTLKSSESVDSGPSHPVMSGSAPSRGDSVWAKPAGALPLSFFGEVDEAEEPGTGATGPSSEDNGAGLFGSKTGGGDSVKDEKSKGSASVSDLIADLYKRSQDENGSRTDASGSGFNQRGSESVERADSNEAVGHHLKSGELYSGWDWSNANEANSSTKESDLHVESVDLNQNGLDSAKQANLSAKAVDFDRHDEDDDDDDDGWEFKAAESSRDVEEDSSTSKNSQIKTQDGIVSDVNRFSENWNALSSDFNGWSWNVDSSSNWSNQSADGNRKLANSDMHSKALSVDENLEVSASSWDFMNSGSNKMGSNSSVLNSSGRELNSVSADENKDFNDSDGWGFKDAEPDLKVGSETDAGDHTRTQNILLPNLNGSDASWDLLSFKGEGMNSKVNGLNSDTKQVNFNSLDETDNTRDEDGWEFKVAESESYPRDGDTKLEFSEEGIKRSEAGNVTSGMSDLTGASPKNYDKSVEFEFDYSAGSFTQNGAMDHKNEWNDGKSSTADDRVDSDKDSWNAFSEIKSMDKGIKTSLSSHKGALPLSIFGYEEEEIDDPVIHEDSSFQISTSNPSDVTKRPLSNNSISDLISTLYSQAESVATTSLAQNSSENGFSYNNTATPPNLMNTYDDFDDDSWEFKDASSGTEVEDQASVYFHGESHTKCSNKLEPKDIVNFFSRLKLELLFVAQCHVDNLKKVGSATASEDAEIHTSEKEIQDLHSKLDHSGITFDEHSENHLPGKICLSQFLEVLKQPEFQSLESEYQLSKKLSLAESDLTSTIDLLKHVVSVVKILNLASKVEQSAYVSTWYKMLSVCAQELEHGGFIWKQAFQKNLHDQMLSEPQGKKHILALGEIYRIVQVLGFSARLYKPWVLASSAELVSLCTLLSDCSKIWSSCGLEEALQSISDSAGFKSDESAVTLLESINYIHNLDELMLYEHVFSGQGSFCQLSALAAETIPGMKMVFWNQEQYFLTLANFWANLVSVDPPELPHIRIGE